MRMLLALKDNKCMAMMVYLRINAMGMYVLPAFQIK